MRELGETLTTMENARIGSMPIVDAEAKPLGIFTRQDVIARVVLPQRPLTAPMRDVMSAPAVTLPAEATAGDAAFVMAQRGIRHVVVVDGSGKVAGVVTERDLFSLQRLSVRELASAIRRAADIPALVQCAADVRALSHTLVAQGVAAGQLTRMISSLNDNVAAQILALTAPAHDLSDVAVCWLGMGSEGRGEQTIATDQDNGLIFVANDEARAPDAIRETPAAPRTRRQRGAGPLRLSAVQRRRDGDESALVRVPRRMEGGVRRLDRPGRSHQPARRQHLLRLPALWGEPRLADALRADIAKRAQANSRFLKQMSDNALRNRPPLNWCGELQAAEDDAGVEGIDLKMNGSVPFVDAARIFALAAGITATNTVERLSRRPRSAGFPPARSAPGATRSSTCSCCACASSIVARPPVPHAASDSNPNVVPLAAAAGPRPPHPEGGDAAGPQDPAAPRGRLPGMSPALASLRRWFGSRVDAGPASAGGRWVVVDTETSGLDPERDRLLAIGAVAVDDGGIVLDDSFEIVLKGERSGDAANIVVHGIGHGAQAAGTPVPAALAAFRDWAADAPRVGFHTDFDRKVLLVAFAGAGMPVDDRPWLDLAPLAAALVPEAYRYGGRSLDDWLAAFGIECTIRHNAASDALATAELLLRLRALAAKQGTRGFDALIRAARQQKWLGNAR